MTELFFVETFQNFLYSVDMLSYFINLFLAVIVICLNIYFFMMNYHTFSLNFIHLHVTLMVCLKTKFLLRTIKHSLYYLILNSSWI